MTLMQVNVGGQRLVSAITNESGQELALKSGDPVTVLVRSSDVMLIKGDTAQVKISANNRLAGEVTSVQDGNGIAFVTLKAGNVQLGAAITSEALDDLQLNNRDFVTAAIKATEVMVQKGEVAWPLASGDF